MRNRVLIALGCIAGVVVAGVVGSEEFTVVQSEGECLVPCDFVADFLCLPEPAPEGLDQRRETINWVQFHGVVACVGAEPCHRAIVQPRPSRQQVLACSRQPGGSVTAIGSSNVSGRTLRRPSHNVPRGLSARRSGGEPLRTRPSTRFALHK